MPYAGINVLILWSAALERGFNSPSWMTYNQATELNAHIRKGEKGSLVVYANTFKKTEENADGQEIEREIPFLRGYTVFNVDQIDGLPEHYFETREPKFTELERIGHAEAFLAATHADIRCRGCRAYYVQDADYIQVPPIESFRDAESFYSTVLHELCHWVKHPSRLNRDFGRKSWGDEGYAREELVAELGSAFLCADLGLTAEVRDDHAAYLASWVAILKNDDRAIFQAQPTRNAPLITFINSNPNAMRPPHRRPHSYGELHQNRWHPAEPAPHFPFDQVTTWG